MGLESFVLKINIKSFKTTNVAIGLLIFGDVDTFLPELWELVNDGAWEDLEDDLLGEDNVEDFAEEADVGVAFVGDCIWVQFGALLA